MAALSSADKTYMADMATHQQDSLATAKAYLQTAPGNRRANLSDQARSVIRMADNCCCDGAGCACCATGCCWDGSCGCCDSGCGCGDNAADSTATASM